MEQRCCKMLVKAFRSKLFYNACRHHIYELIIGDVYTSLFGGSSAPNDINFKCFRAEWPKIDLSKDYHILEMSSEWLREKSKLVICELQQIIEKEKTTTQQTCTRRPCTGLKWAMQACAGEVNLCRSCSGLLQLIFQKVGIALRPFIGIRRLNFHACLQKNQLDCQALNNRH